MTENSFLDGPAEVVEEPSGGRRRLLILGGSVVAIAALGFGGYTLLGGSGDASTSAMPVVHHVLARTQVHPAVTKTTTIGTVPVVSTQRIGKDPFIALYLQPAPAAAPAAAPATTTSTATSGSSTSSSTVTPVATTYAMKLTRVYGSGKDTTGVFTINSRSQLAKVGTVFGPTSEIKLLSFSQSAKGVWTATAQVGDGQPFDAILNQTVYVR